MADEVTRRVEQPGTPLPPMGGPRTLRPYSPQGPPTSRTDTAAHCCSDLCPFHALHLPRAPPDSPHSTNPELCPPAPCSGSYGQGCAACTRTSAGPAGRAQPGTPRHAPSPQGPIPGHRSASLRQSAQPIADQPKTDTPSSPVPNTWCLARVSFAPYRSARTLRVESVSKFYRRPTRLRKSHSSGEGQDAATERLLSAGPGSGIPPKAGLLSSGPTFRRDGPPGPRG